MTTTGATERERERCIHVLGSGNTPAYSTVRTCEAVSLCTRVRARGSARHPTERVSVEERVMSLTKTAKVSTQTGLRTPFSPIIVVISYHRLIRNPPPSKDRDHCGPDTLTSRQRMHSELHRICVYTAYVPRRTTTGILESLRV